MAARVSIEITNKDDINELLSLTEDDITSSQIIELFGEFNEKQRFHPYDTFTVPAGAYGQTKKNKNSFKTTVGLWIFNKYVFERELGDFIGYINYEVNGDKWEDIISKITQAVLEDELELQYLHHVLVKSQHLMPMCTILTPTVTEKFLNLPKYMAPKKDELFEKYKEQLDAGDIVTAGKVEDELMAYAMDYLKDDPSLDLYLSKSRSKLGNDFKNMYLCKGAMIDPDPNAAQQFHIAKSCYNDGIAKEEYALFANDLSAGPYSRARKTAIGGYWEKLTNSAYQHIRLGAKDSDCGTKDTITVTLTPKNINSWMYSYVKEGDKLICITSKNKDKYVGQTVKMRFASLCEAKGCICNKCVGDLFYMLEYENIGLAMMIIMSKIKNINMKQFHDSTVNTSKIDPVKAFGY